MRSRLWEDAMETVASRPTAFVGMLYTDEAQFESALRAVREQQGCSISYEVIAGFAEQEASRRLYSGFNDGSGRFDVRARVDADMVIVSPYLLAAAAGLFAEESRVDTITVPLHDFFTGKAIKGLHLWRREVRWLSMPGPLFGDAVFDTSRRTFTVTDLPQPVALHAPDPSPSQSARYGSHRALKALTKGPDSKRWGHFRSVITTQNQEPHPARLISIAALFDAISGGDLDSHVRAALGERPLDIERFDALAQDPALIDRITAILEDRRELSRICESRGPLVAAATRAETAGRRRLAFGALALRTRQAAGHRMHGAPQEASLRSRFLELLRM